MYPQHYVWPKGALALLETSHPLRAEALKQFRDLFVCETGDRESYTRLDREIKAQGLILPETLLEMAPEVLPQLLTALGGVLRRFFLNCNAILFDDHSWFEVFVREARPVTELITNLKADNFPFAKLIGDCTVLKRLHVVLAAYSPPRLDDIVEHASQLTELLLEGVDNFAPVYRTLKRLPPFEHLSEIVADEFHDSFPASKMFEGVSHR